MKKYWTILKNNIVVVLLSVLLIVAIVYVSAGKALSKQNKKDGNVGVIISPTPTIVDEIRNKIEVVQQEAEINKAIVSAKTEEDKKELEEIAKLDDAAERRKKLAEKLSKL